MCMKNQPGRPCESCGGGGCVPCTINRIDVTFAQPTPGQPGASIGSWGWDVTTQPTPVEVPQNVFGVIQTVCRQIYTAPTQVSCLGTGADLSWNTYFKTVERSIFADYYLSAFGGARFLFEGNFLWRVYAYVADLAFTVYRFGGLSRTVLSGVFHLTRERHHVGRRREFLSSSCTVIEDVTLAAPSTHDPCARLLPDNPCNLISLFTLSQTNLVRLAYSINSDTGWVTGNCASLPVTPTNSPDIFGGYNSFLPPGACRVPSGSTTTTLGPDFISCAGFPSTYFQHTETYTTDDVWFARHPITLS